MDKMSKKAAAKANAKAEVSSAGVITVSGTEGSIGAGNTES